MMGKGPRCADHTPKQLLFFLVGIFYAGTLLLTACQPFSFTETINSVMIKEDAIYQRVLSPSEKWELILLAEVGWAYAPHTITVVRRATDTDPAKGKLITRFQLYNDGANLSDSNCSVRWQMDATQELAFLTCDGQEQDPQLYELDIPAATLLQTTDTDLHQ